MIAITIRQPWASLIVAGIKPVENRSWPTRHRGPLLVHAGARVDPDGLARMHALGIILPDMPTGGIVGRVQLVGCIRDSDSEWAAAEAWHWLLANPCAVDFCPMRGSLGLFRVPAFDPQMSLLPA
jgi:ASCH domain